MFMDWKYQYCKVDRSSYLDLQIQQNSNKNTNKLFVKINKQILKFMWKSDRPKRVNKMLNKKNIVGRLTVPNIKTYYSFLSGVLAKMEA